MSLQGGIYFLVGRDCTTCNNHRFWVGGVVCGRSRWRIVVVEEGESVGEEDHGDTKVNYSCGHISELWLWAY